jgi:hypothetical protein
MGTTERIPTFSQDGPARRGAVDRILGAANQIGGAVTAVERIRKLHSRRPLLIRGTTVETWQCGHCETEYPCPTIRILERSGL